MRRTYYLTAFLGVSLSATLAALCFFSFSAVVALMISCDLPPDAPASPSDDPADYDHLIDTSLRYQPQLSQPRFVVPSDRLPAAVKAEKANNNVDIILYQGRLYMAWRSAPSHFASAFVKMVVVSSADEGDTWRFEKEIVLRTDVREPRFVAIRNRLVLYFVQLGTNPLQFEPSKVWRTELRKGHWSAPEIVSSKREVIWRIKTRGGHAYMTSYVGLHYGTGKGDLRVMFRRSLDGLNWTDVDPSQPSVYRGGVSEAAFEFEADGRLWAITRNEDGDDSGFGSHLCVAEPQTLAKWDCPDRADPERYDSPEMLRHGDDLYIVARRDIGGPFDKPRDNMSFNERKTQNLAEYSLRPKRTALYRVDRDARRVVHLRDLPSAGDTAFPSVRRLDAHRFIIANYTSPLTNPDISWIKGQVADEGTSIYLITLSFTTR